MNPLVTLSSAALPGAVRDDLLTAAALGSPVWGPLALLGDLELRLGIPPPNPSGAERTRCFAERMERLLDARPFFAASFAVNRLGTAAALLELRDSLIDAGWNGESIPGGGPRLDALAAIEHHRDVPFPTGPSDRLLTIERALQGARRTPYESLSLLPEERQLWPGRWRRVFERLAQLGTSLKTIAPIFRRAPLASDLGRVHAALLGESVAHGQLGALGGDGSVMFLRAETSLELAEAVAATIQDLEGAVVVRGGDPIALDLTLVAHGLPPMGDRAHRASQPLLQVLPLALGLRFAPKDARCALDLLLLPGGPIDPYVGRRLAHALAEAPTISGPHWNERKSALVAALDTSSTPPDLERTRRLREALDAVKDWLEAPSFAPAVPRSELLETTCRVRRWLGDAPWDALAVANAALAQAAEVEAALMASQADVLSRVDLQKILDAAPGMAPSPTAFPRAGRPDHVDDPRLLLRSRSAVVWWHFTPEPQPGRALPTWRNAERRAMARAGFDIGDPGIASSATAEGWRRAALAANRRLILALPSAVAGDRPEPHPLWDEILGRLGATAADEARVTVRARDFLRTHPRHKPLSPLALPPPRAEWNAPAASLLATTHSPTSLDTLFTCPFRWALRHRAEILRRNLTSLLDRRILEGTLGHRLSELLVNRGVLVQGPGAVAAAVPALLDQLVDEEASHLRAPGMSFELHAIRRMLSRAADALARLLQRAQLHPVSAELPFEVPWRGAILAGRADLVAETRDRARAVVDLKLGSATRFRNEIRGGRAIQLAAYGFALRSGDAPADYAATAYFSLTNATAVGTDAEIFALAQAASGPGVKATWSRIDRTMDRFEALFRDGRIPVTGLDSSPDLVWSLGVPESEIHVHVQGKTKKELREKTCRHCEYAPICGRQWEEPQ